MPAEVSQLLKETDQGCMCRMTPQQRQHCPKVVEAQGAWIRFSVMHWFPCVFMLPKNLFSHFTSLREFFSKKLSDLLF